MRRLVMLAVVIGCSQRPAPRTPLATPAPAPSSPVPAPVVSPWPVPVRVMTWTASGIVQVGELPAAPPAQPPATPWYVEPTRTLDATTFARLIVAVRAERVPGLSLRGQPVAPWLGELRDLPDLAALILDDTTVDSAALATIDVALRRLYLAGTLVDDTGIIALAPKQPALEVLDLEDCAIGDAGVAAIAKLSELRALNLGQTRVTDAGSVALAKLGKLEIIDLGRTTVGARAVATIRNLPVREVFLDGTAVGRELASLSVLAPGLERLELSSLASYKPTDADLGWLARAPHLVEVGLSGSRVHDPLVIAIAALPQLRELRVATTPITLAAVKAIAARQDLEEVDLAETPVDDASAAALLAMPRMRVLRLDRTSIGDGALVRPAGPLVELYLSHTRITDAGLAILDAAPDLEALGLGHAQIGDPTIARIAKLRRLHTLVLSRARANREALVELGALHDLERLYLDDTRADDTTLAALAPALHLRVLHLGGSDVSAESLPMLRTLRLLEELTIGDTRMPAAITDVAAWPRLRALSIVGLAVGDAELPALARRTSLETIDLSGTEVRDPKPLVALPRLQLLGLEQTALTPDGLAAVKALKARGVRIVR
jgi:hypothetical protein